MTTQLTIDSEQLDPLILQRLPTIILNEMVTITVSLFQGSIHGTVFSVWLEQDGLPK